jgi:hypothetical protein
VLTGGAVSGSTSGPNMKYTIAAGGSSPPAAAASDGLYVFANDGALTIDSGAPAPSSGTRWDLIWVRHKNAIEGGGDAVTPCRSAGVTVGTSGSTPTKPYASVPAGALVLAEALVGTSIANASLATITQVAPSRVGPRRRPDLPPLGHVPDQPGRGQHVDDLALHRTPVLQRLRVAAGRRRLWVARRQRHPRRKRLRHRHPWPRVQPNRRARHPGHRQPDMGRRRHLGHRDHLHDLQDPVLEVRRRLGLALGGRHRRQQPDVRVPLDRVRLMGDPFYSWHVGELRTGRLTAEVPFSAASWQSVMDDAGALSFTTAVTDPAVRLLDLYTSAEPCRCFLAVSYTDATGTETFLDGGPVWTHSYDSASGQLTVAGAGLWSYYDHRKILPVLARRREPGHRHQLVHRRARHRRQAAHRSSPTPTPAGRVPVVLPADEAGPTPGPTPATTWPTSARRCAT